MSGVDGYVTRAQALRDLRVRARTAKPGWDHAVWATYDDVVAALPPSGFEGARQAKDLPDGAVMAVVRVLGGRSEMVTRFDVAAALGVPGQLALAKLRRLVRRGLLDGCPCGCRGDFEIPQAA